MKKQLHKTILLFLLTILSMDFKTQTIYTFAGGGTNNPGNGGPSTAAILSYPAEVAIDALGNVYFADLFNNRIRKVNTSGIITTVAGTGTSGYSGDGGLATSAQIWGPSGVAVDALGNIYIADEGTVHIRKINTSGIISTIAGTGSLGCTGDGGLATSAKIDVYFGLAADKFGNVYFADWLNNRVRKVSTSGIINTIAGTGVGGYSGDGGLATLAQLSSPSGVCVDTSGNVYIGDAASNVIRKINTSGIISTIAGTVIAGFSGDGGPATAAQLSGPSGLAADNQGNIFVMDIGNSRIRKINSAGIITTVAGTGAFGFSGDGGPALLADLDYSGAGNNPSVDAFGNLYFTDTQNKRVRVICTNNCPLSLNISKSEINNQFFVYPNPNSGSFKLQIDIEIKNAEIILINSLGQKVYEQKIYQGQNNIITNGLATGLYNYIILRDKGQISNGKLTVE